MRCVSYRIGNFAGILDLFSVDELSFCGYETKFIDWFELLVLAYTTFLRCIWRQTITVLQSTLHWILRKHSQTSTQ